jgi:hypothetical protein
MPESVKTVIIERVESLGKNAVELLRMASVIGREFALQLLQEFTGEEEEELIKVMDRCEEVGLVHSGQGLGEKSTPSHTIYCRRLFMRVSAARDDGAAICE